MQLSDYFTDINDNLLIDFSMSFCKYEGNLCQTYYRVCVYTQESNVLRQTKENHRKVSEGRKKNSHRWEV